VKGWIDQGAFSVAFGESNVGKTFFGLDLAMHVAAGEDWHGARIPSGANRAGSVLYVAGEGGRGVNNRIEALRLARPELVAAAAREGGFALLPTALDLCGEGDAGAIIEALEHMRSVPALIIIDTLARAMGGGDENSGQDMGALIRNVDLIRE
jgi:RecA-family ATPase